MRTICYSIFLHGCGRYPRLASIDAPELKGQPYGKASKRFLNDLIYGETVRVKVTTKDRYKRFVAWVYLHDLCINEKMVATGYAWQYIKYSDDRELARLERIARNKRRGLWRDDNPTPPWEWRSKKKPKRISRKVTRNKNLRPVKASRVETSTLKLIEQYSMDIQSRIAQNWDMRGFYTNRKDFKTVIIVKISKDGNIDKIMFEHKSGNSYFDDQCFEAVKKSGPFSPLPDSWKRDHFELAVGFTPKGLSR